MRVVRFATVGIRALAFLLLVGCRQLLGLDQPELAPDATIAACSSNAECAIGVCKLPDGLCVECLDATDCPVATPVCGPTNTCELCDDHDDCLSEVCNLPTGECIDESSVLYVTEGGLDDTVCTRALPCGSLDDGFRRATETRPFIKVSGAIIDTITAGSKGRDAVVFGAPGARLGRSNLGNIVAIENGSTVSMFDLEISGAQNGTGITVNNLDTTLVLERVVLRDNAQRGIQATNGAHVTLRRCVVSGNVAGGANLEGTVELTNNLIVRNGTTASNSGGLRLDPAPGSTVEFNTIADNASLSSSNSGVVCVDPFPASNNIVTGNGTDPTCTFAFSLFDGTTVPLPAGTGNRTGDPAFANTNPAQPGATSYYRLTASSAAVDQADPASALAIDLDGEARPNGAAHDIGADEFTP